MFSKLGLFVVVVMLHVATCHTAKLYERYDAMAKSNGHKAEAKAAKVYGVGEAYAVPVSDIHWLRSMNDARDTQPLLEPSKVSKKTGDNVHDGVWESLIARGWSPELPCQGILLPYAYIGDDGKQHTITADDCVADRQEQVKAAEKDNPALAETLKAIWTKDGKYVRPVFVANSGFTRGLSLPNIIGAKGRAMAAGGVEYDPSTFTVHVVVKHFASESDRVSEQAFENESRTMAGVTSMNWLDRIKSGQRILASRRAEGKPANQSVLRDAFGVGNGQKLWSILTADGRFGDKLRLLERIRLPQPKDFRKDAAWYSAGGYIPVASIPQQAAELRDAPDVETAEKFIREKVFGAGGGNAPKVLGKDVWKDLPTNYGCQDGSPMAAIADAHLNGKGFDAIKATYPELFSADYTGGIAEAKAKPARKGSKAKA